MFQLDMNRALDTFRAVPIVPLSPSNILSPPPCMKSGPPPPPCAIAPSHLLRNSVVLSRHRGKSSTLKPSKLCIGRDDDRTFQAAQQAAKQAFLEPMTTILKSEVAAASAANFAVHRSA